MSTRITILAATLAVLAWWSTGDGPAVSSIHSVAGIEQSDTSVHRAPPGPLDATGQPRVTDVTPDVLLPRAISLDELELPDLGASEAIRPLSKHEDFERLDTLLCYRATSTETVAETVRSRLAADGWTRIEITPFPNRPDRFGVNAHKLPYRATGTVQAGRFPECSAERGDTYVGLAITRNGLQSRAL